MQRADKTQKYSEEELERKLTSFFGYQLSNSELQIAERIYRFISKQEWATTEPEIMFAIAGKRSSKISVLRKLVEASVLFRSAEGRKGRPFQYFSAPEQIRQTASEAKSNPESTAAINEALNQAGGSAITAETQSEAYMSLQGTAQKEIYKRLRIPSGDILEVTREEFDQIVAFYRELNKQADSCAKLPSTDKIKK
jgi:hypothetical protein